MFNLKGMQKEMNEAAKILKKQNKPIKKLILNETDLAVISELQGDTLNAAGIYKLETKINEIIERLN